MNEDQLLQRITVNPDIFGGKPIIRGRRLAVEHVLGMLAAGDDMDTLLEGYPWLERDDILACLAYAHRLVEHERVDRVGDIHCKTAEDHTIAGGGGNLDYHRSAGLCLEFDEGGAYLVVVAGL